MILTRHILSINLWESFIIVSSAYQSFSSYIVEVFWDGFSVGWLKIIKFFSFNWKFSNLRRIIRDSMRLTVFHGHCLTHLQRKQQKALIRCNLKQKKIDNRFHVAKSREYFPVYVVWNWMRKFRFDLIQFKSLA